MKDENKSCTQYSLDKSRKAMLSCSDRFGLLHCQLSQS